MSTGLVIKYGELKTSLKKAGCSKVREGKGDHEIWQNPEGQRFTVPVCVTTRSTLNSIHKAAGIKPKAEVINAQRHKNDLLLKAAESKAQKWANRLSKSDRVFLDRPSADKRRALKKDYKLTAG